MAWRIFDNPPPPPPPPTPTLTPTPKHLPPDPTNPNEDDWDTKEEGTLTEDYGVNPLLLSMPTSLCCRSPPLQYVPYPHRYFCHCPPLECLRLSVFCRQFYPRQTPHVFSYAPLSSHLCNILSLHPDPPPPLPLYLTTLHLYLYIYIYPLTQLIYPLSLTHSLSLYIYLTY